MRKIKLISTGGTIEKTYDERSGILSNRHSVVEEMLGALRLENIRVGTTNLMSKDSLDLTDADRQIIAAAEIAAMKGPVDAATCCGIVLLHGTDTLCETGEFLHRHLVAPMIPVILTGAMRPFEMKHSDAQQNLTEAIFATGVLAPGIWVVAHGRALEFPGPVKDRARGTFARSMP